ncbi:MULTISPECIES: HPr family phosphocarrier protein [Halomonas]|uniref:HPr family phosphocarrier protein n=1 Tax=Halomonas binhaiensis TaxID=2562282 RepID=A0A5C1NFX1_9GAMM|nr:MULTISPECIES: HPr family phosphocarrier protein [Halomonas]QEM81308.1 HPr family phosphocarrier protein [Halomonas binhaiensis]
MPQRQLTLINKRGLHARAATRLVQCCQTFQSQIIVRRDHMQGDGANIMSLLMLAAPCGTELIIEAEGDDAESALDAIEALFTARFDEED